jgi:hypothetical protein
MTSADQIEKANGNGIELNSLMQKLQTEDARNLRVFSTFRYLFPVLMVLYGLFFIANPSDEFDWLDRLTGLCYVLAFGVFAWLFRKYHKEYRSIDYSLPVADMLRKAADRYSLWQRKTLILVVPILLIDVGMSISTGRHQDYTTPLRWTLLVQLAYIPLLAVSFLVGVWIWYHRQRPLREGALSLLAELKE